MSVTQRVIYWQDENLETRSQATATTENVNLSYLHLKILARDVERTDEATYLCVLFASKDFSIILQESDEISLNITGTVTLKKNLSSVICCIEHYF